MEEKATINEVAANLFTEAQRLGFDESYLWRHWMPRISSIAKYYRNRGLCIYDPAITDEFLQIEDGRYRAEEIAYATLKAVRLAARRLNEFYLTGTLRVDTTDRGTRYRLSAQSERLIDLFVVHQKYGENTRDDAVWAVRKYLHHFETLGHETLETVTVEDARRFIMKTAAEVRTSTLHDLFLYLRHFHIWLKKAGINAPDCVELFSHTVHREMPIQGYVTDDELERILGVIDATNELGKRNRAIILLGATTGMRACDIIRLKLTDIDWRKGEIRLEQDKTEHTVCLPLLAEAGQAIQDYILNARPQTGCPELFLRCCAPKTAIMNAVCIGSMFKSYQKQAGINRVPFDGKGFHGLRRRLAKKLLESGSSLAVIAQILGHEDVRSALQYLCLDTDNLRECALDFSGIPIVRRELL